MVHRTCAKPLNCIFNFPIMGSVTNKILLKFQELIMINNKLYNSYF